MRNLGRICVNFIVFWTVLESRSLFVCLKLLHENQFVFSLSNYFFPWQAFFLLLSSLNFSLSAAEQDAFAGLNSPPYCETTVLQKAKPVS